MEQFVQFKVEGEWLYGMAHFPDADQMPPPAHGWPLLLLLHGFTGSRSSEHRLFPLFSRYLAGLGIASVRFDFRGSGDSQGDFAAMTTSREVADALTAAEYARQLPQIDPERLMLLGYSLGGMVAALAAPEMRPHRLALWSPALPESWLRQLPAGQLPPSVLDYRGWPLGRGFFQDLLRLDPLKAAQGWGGVARVFHGDSDETCPPEFGVRYAQALGCDAVGIPGADHGYRSAEQTEMLYRETAKFLVGQ